MEEILKKIINDYLKRDLEELIEKKRKNGSNILTTLFYGRIMGKLSLLPTIVTKQYKEDDPYQLGLALAEINDFCNFIITKSEHYKPKHYDCIMEILNEN